MAEVVSVPVVSVLRSGAAVLAMTAPRKLVAPATSNAKPPPAEPSTAERPPETPALIPACSLTDLWKSCFVKVTEYLAFQKMDVTIYIVKKEHAMSPIIKPLSIDDNQAALDAVIKGKAKARLAKPAKLIDHADVFAGLKTRHQQRNKRVA
jgi:hypothetical protein